MKVRISELQDAKRLKGIKSVYTMSIRYEYGKDFYSREENNSGEVTWSIYNNGMYDEQNETNSASLEATFQKYLKEK